MTDINPEYGLFLKFGKTNTNFTERTTIENIALKKFVTNEETKESKSCTSYLPRNLQIVVTKRKLQMVVL